MRESELLAHIAARSARLSRDFPHVRLGPGDDCAVVDLGPGSSVLTTDHVVEGRHFETLGPNPAPEYLKLIARKAIARSISDLAAMAAEPVCSLATACLPPGFPQAAADTLFDAMHHHAAAWRCPLVGGDIASFSPDRPGPLVLTTTAIGRAHRPDMPFALRSHARPGHGVYVTGSLGGSLRTGRHLTFEPRLAEARELASITSSDGHRLLGAMIDLSDGLGRDAARIARASSVQLRLEAAAIPCTSGCDWRSATSDGEDYELLFTFDDSISPPPGTLTGHGVSVTRIGEVGAAASTGLSPCIIRLPDGTALDAAELGWDHT